MLYIVDDVLVADDEAAEGREAFGEGPHGDIDFFHQTEMGRRSPSSAEDSDRVRVVHIYAGAMRLANGHELGKIDDVSTHREYAVHDDQDALFGGYLRQYAVELVEIAVDETLHLRHSRAYSHRRCSRGLPCP